MNLPAKYMNLPAKYKWLEVLVPLPVMVSTALQYLGIKEIPGKQNNPVIMNMAKQLGVEKIYTNDDTSWCALFMSYICMLCGKPLPDLKGDPYNMLRAAWFLEWGEHEPINQAMLGDVLIFARPGGNHVGLYIAESKTTFHVLGGNQSNAVTITEIAKDRLKGVRRLYRTGVPSTVKKYQQGSSGLISKNEV